MHLATLEVRIVHGVMRVAFTALFVPSSKGIELRAANRIKYSTRVLVRLGASFSTAKAILVPSCLMG